MNENLVWSVKNGAEDTNGKGKDVRNRLNYIKRVSFNIFNSRIRNISYSSYAPQNSTFIESKKEWLELYAGSSSGLIVKRNNDMKEFFNTTIPNGFHMNDCFYDSIENEIHIATMNQNAQVIILDYNTLTIKDTKNLNSYSISQIAKDKVTNTILVSYFKPGDIKPYYELYDTNYNKLKEVVIKNFPISNCDSQGCEFNNGYIYTLFSHKQDETIFKYNAQGYFVYDLNGNLIDTVTIDTSLYDEVESIQILDNGNMYIFSYDSDILFWRENRIDGINPRSLILDQATYYVDENYFGEYSDGSKMKPFNTIEHALLCARTMPYLELIFSSTITRFCNSKYINCGYLHIDGKNNKCTVPIKIKSYNRIQIDSIDFIITSGDFSIHVDAPLVQVYSCKFNNLTNIAIQLEYCNYKVGWNSFNNSNIALHLNNACCGTFYANNGSAKNIKVDGGSTCLLQSNSISITDTIDKSYGFIIEK